jgi:glycosyltransferase 2 family protein
MAPSRHYAFKVALVGAILGLLFYFVPVAEVGAALAGVAPGYLAIGVLLQFLMRAVSTPRMRVIAANQGVDLSHGQLFRILLITQYYALLLPGTLAAGGATWLKYVQAGASKSAAVAAVMLNRGIGTLVMMVTGAVAWSLARDPAQAGVAPVLVVLCSALLLVAVFGHLPFLSTREIRLSGPRWVQWLGGLINRLLQFQRVSPGGKLIVLASSLAHELVGALTIWCFALAVGLSLDLLTVVWMRAALQVALMAPLHIAGFGIREASLVGLGALVGVAPAAAVAWSLVIFAGSLVVSAVGGLLEANSMAGYFARPKTVAVAKARRESGS